MVAQLPTTGELDRAAVQDALELRVGIAASYTVQTPAKLAGVGGCGTAVRTVVRVRCVWARAIAPARVRSG